MDVSSKMIQQGKLAWLVWGFEHDCLEPECIDKPVGICGIQVSRLIEQSDALRAFPGLDDQFDCASVEPFPSLVNPLRERLIAEPAVMFFPELHLNVEPAALCGHHDRTRIE